MKQLILNGVIFFGISLGSIYAQDIDKYRVVAHKKNNPEVTMVSNTVEVEPWNKFVKTIEFSKSHKYLIPLGNGVKDINFYGLDGSLVKEYSTSEELIDLSQITNNLNAENYVMLVATQEENSSYTINLAILD